MTDAVDDSALGMHRKTRRVERGVGTLDVREIWYGDRKLYEVFTLTSLESALGLTTNQLEARYRRANLRLVVMFIDNEFGRPIRCFPLDAYPLVADILTANHGQLRRDGQQVVYSRIGRRALVADLVGVRVDSELYFSAESIGRAFGVSGSAVRQRMKAAGLYSRFISLWGAPGGGRTRRGIPKELLGQVKIAMCDVALATAREDLARAKATGAVAPAQAEMEQAIVVLGPTLVWPQPQKPVRPGRTVASLMAGAARAPAGVRRGGVLAPPDIAPARRPDGDTMPGAAVFVSQRDMARRTAADPTEAELAQFGLDTASLEAMLAALPKPKKLPVRFQDDIEWEDGPSDGDTAQNVKQNPDEPVDL